MLKCYEIDYNLNFKIASLFNYQNLLNEEKNKFIFNNNNKIYKDYEEINNKKIEILLSNKENLKNNYKFNLSEESKDDKLKINNNKLLLYDFPEFEIFLVLKLYVNEMKFQQEFTTKILFNSKNINKEVFFRFKYKDLTSDSKIKIEVYSIQLEKEKSLIGETTINLFDSYLHLLQGKYLFNIKIEEVKEDIEIEKNLNNLIQKYNNNYKKNKNYTTSLNALNDNEIINFYYFDDDNNIILKDENMLNYEDDLNDLLLKTKKSFIEIEFPSFEKTVIFEEKESSSYKKPFNKIDLNKNNWICDTIINIEKNSDEYLKLNNPSTDKFVTLLQSIHHDINPNEMKLSSNDRLTLFKLLNKPDFITLDKNTLMLFWMYRFELLKNDTPSALTKILNALEWGNQSIENEFIKTILIPWKTVEIGDILYMLSRKFSVNDLYSQENINKKNLNGMKKLRKYAVQQLQKKDDNKINFILLQLVQALRYEDKNDSSLKKFLIEKCSKNINLATSFYWFLKVEKDNEKTKTKEELKMNIYNEIFNEFVQKIKNFDEINKNIQNQEEFHTNLLKISSELTKYKYADDKKRYLKEILKEKDKGLGKEMSNNFYLPLYPQVIVNGVELDKCTVFPSAMCPVKYDFNVTPETSKYLKKDENDNDDHSFYSVIFKNGDDIRQDQLILQIISFMDLLLKEDKNNFEFTTYKVMATSKQSGFVEFVNNSETISYILKNYNNVIESYIKKFSNNDEKTFDEHLNNYINSLAGYSIVTYILGIGDRHLENLMIDQKGKLFHIDFGYILGKDPKFYTTPIRLDLQMFKCIGNKIEEFKNLCVKCFLTLRENARLIVNLLYLMKDSGIPELNNLENLNKLYNKFFPGYTKQQAAEAILKVLEDSIYSYSYAFNDKFHSIANYWK